MSWESFCRDCRDDSPFISFNFDHEEETSVITSLTDMCCKIIVQNSIFLKTCCSSLPSDVYDELMMCALKNGYSSSAFVLMVTWPYQTISIRNLSPTNLDDLKVVYEYEYRKKSMKTKAQITAIILRSFLDALKIFTPSRLQILDLRGIPMSDAVLTFFLTLFPKNDLLSKDYYILVDVFCLDATTCSKLMATLENIDNKIHVHFNSLATLSIAQEYEPSLQVLLEYANQKDLTSLSVHSQYLTTSTVNNPPSLDLWKFQNLADLSIFYDVQHDDDTNQQKQHLYKILPNIFDKLPQLSRLKLSYLPLTDNLRQMLPLPGIARLDHLNLTGCKLGESDLIYLTTASLRLRELHLSSDLIFTQQIDLLLDLLLSLSVTLKILELENCIKSDDIFPSLVTCVLSLPSLRYLDLFAYQLSWNCLRDNIPTLGSMEQLECVHLCDDHDQNIHLRREIETCMANKRNPPVLIKWQRNK